MGSSRSTRDRRPPPRSGPSTASAVEPVEASVRGAEHRRRHASALVQVLKPNLDARRDFVSYCAYYVTVPAKIEHVLSRNRCQRGEQRAVRCARPPAVDGKNKNSMTHVLYRSPECQAQNLLPWGPGSLAHRWRDAWPSLSLGARTQVELLDAIRGYHLVAGCFHGVTVSYRSQERRARELLPWGLLSFVSLARRAASRSDIWTRVRAVESAVSSRRCIANMDAGPRCCRKRCQLAAMHRERLPPRAPSVAAARALWDDAPFVGTLVCSRRRAGA